MCQVVSTRRLLRLLCRVGLLLNGCQMCPAKNLSPSTLLLNTAVHPSD
jgi:hypothetical protein